MYAITIPKDVQISWGKDYIKITGILGTVVKKKGNFSLAIKDSVLYFWAEDPKLNVNTYFSFLKNLITGVTQGYSHKLRLVGVGYRAAIQEKNLILKIGYSHEVVYPIPEGIQILAAKAKGGLLIIKGIESFRVNQVAAEIRKLHVPDVYKGKGIHNENENLILKKGKREGK